MLAPTAPGIVMASCRQWSTPGTSLLSAVLVRWPRVRAVTAGHPLATVRRAVAPDVRRPENHASRPAPQGRGTLPVILRTCRGPPADPGSDVAGTSSGRGMHVDGA